MRKKFYVVRIEQNGVVDPIIVCGHDTEQDALTNASNTCRISSSGGYTTRYGVIQLLHIIHPPSVEPTIETIK